MRSPFRVDYAPLHAAAKALSADSKRGHHLCASCVVADGLMRLVENACSDMLISPNWALNMQIVDELNREQDLIV